MLAISMLTTGSNQLHAQLQIIATTTPASCAGSSDGAIVTTVSGGVPPYTYLWSNFAVSPHLNNVPAGIYSVTVQDTAGSSANVSAEITQPEPMELSITPTSANCAEENSGSISSNAIGGTAPYSYSWSNGATTQDINGVSAGLYTLNAMDANGCEINTSIMLDQATSLYVQAVISAGGSHTNFFLANYPDLQGSTFQWQILQGNTWTDLTDTWIVQGSSTPSLMISNQNPGAFVFYAQIRCVVTLNSCVGISNTVTYQAPPYITSISPAQLCPTGPQTVTITGNNFINIGGISVGSYPATSFNVVNSNTIIATFPSVTSSGSISLSAPYLPPSLPFPYSIAQLNITTNSENGISGTVNSIASVNTTNNSFQWQTDIGFGFQNLSNAGQYSGTTTDSLTISNVTAQNNNQLLRCINTSNGCVVTSSVDTVKIILPTLTPGVNSPLPGISYQAIARNGLGNPLINESLQVRLTLHEGNPTGNILYEEEHIVTTNSLGLFTLVFGGGNALLGEFNNIEWLGQSKYLQVGLDYGSGLTDLGTQQLLSVPFAKCAEKAQTIDAISLPIFESNSSAIEGGLQIGHLYRTSLGTICVVH
jgi:hypothetical protein